MNRLGDSNIETIFNDIRDLSLKHSVPEINEAVCQSMLATASLGGVESVSHVVVQCALAAAMHATTGAEVGGIILESATERFIRVREDDDDRREACAMVLIFAHLYNFRVLGTQLLYDIVRALVDSFGSLDIECLLLLLRQAGPQMRRDDPSSLKDIVLAVQARANAMTDERSTSFGARVQFMLDSINELKNNRQAELPELLLVDRLRKLLHKIVEKRGVTLGTNEIKISWKELTSPEAKGRWWVVGSAYSTVDTGLLPASAAAASSSSPAGRAMEDEYARLAKKHRMNTDARRSVFCLLLSSEDFVDAFQKIMKLGLKGPQERDIVLVLLYCCGIEKSFNPYYLHLALKLCSVSHHLRFSFQTAFWDRFKQLDATPPREAANLAMLLAHIVGNKQVPLAVLKPVEFEALSARGVLFFRIFFETLLTEFDEQTVVEVFRKLAARQDDPNLLRTKEGITLFYLQGLGRKSADPNATDEARKKHMLLRDRVKLTKRLLLESASADIF